MTDAPDIAAQIIEVELTILAREDWIDRMSQGRHARPPETIRRAEDRLETLMAVLATLQKLKEKNLG